MCGRACVSGAKLRFVVVVPDLNQVQLKEVALVVPLALVAVLVLAEVLVRVAVLVVAPVPTVAPVPVPVVVVAIAIAVAARVPIAVPLLPPPALDLSVLKWPFFSF